MRRSAHVAAPLLTSAALAMLSGCHQHEMQRCVDEHGAVVADTLCQNQPLQQNNGVPYYHPYGSGGFYRWYYGGTGGYAPGGFVGGGSYAPLAGHSYSSSTSRGGFGSTHASGGEGGHGGGE